MGRFFCYKCKTTSEDATKCANEHCGQLAGYVIDRDVTKRQVLSVPPAPTFTPNPVLVPLEHPNCGTDECCGECPDATTTQCCSDKCLDNCCGGIGCCNDKPCCETQGTDCNKRIHATDPTPITCMCDRYQSCSQCTVQPEAEHDGSVQIKVLAENVNGKLVIHDASHMGSNWIETDMVYEKPDAYLLTLTLDGDKILAALPETKAISVDMR